MGPKKTARPLILERGSVSLWVERGDEGLVIESEEPVQRGVIDPTYVCHEMAMFARVPCHRLGSEQERLVSRAAVRVGDGELEFTGS